MNCLNSKVCASTAFTIANHQIMYRKNYHPKNEPTLWYYVFQSIIFTGSRMIPSATAFIYFIACELLMIYYNRIIMSLELLTKTSNQTGKPMKNSTFKNIIFLAKQCATLNKAARYLQDGMRLILLVNCCFVFFNSFMNFFYFIFRIVDGWAPYFDRSGIHIANLVETMGRFFLFCHATDRINSSVRKILNLITLKEEVEMGILNLFVTIVL